jgi:hypothetical protein
MSRDKPLAGGFLPGGTSADSSVDEDRMMPPVELLGV